MWSETGSSDARGAVPDANANLVDARRDRRSALFTGSQWSTCASTVSAMILAKLRVGGDALRVSRDLRLFCLLLQGLHVLPPVAHESGWSCAACGASGRELGGASGTQSNRIERRHEHYNLARPRRPSSHATHLSTHPPRPYATRRRQLLQCAVNDRATDQSTSRRPRIERDHQEHLRPPRRILQAAPCGRGVQRERRHTFSDGE